MKIEEAIAERDSLIADGHKNAVACLIKTWNPSFEEQCVVFRSPIERARWENMNKEWGITAHTI